MSVYIEPKKKWSESKEADGITKEKTVAEVENGFIIVKRVYGSKPGAEGEDSEYIDESKAFISETNPLDEDDMKAGLDSLLGNF